MPRAVAIAGFLLLLSAASLASAIDPDADRLPSYITSISAQLDARVGQTLRQLDGTGRQLLALRSYVRSASHLAEDWSWTREQIEAFEGSTEQRELQQEIDRVRAAFVAANPGFELQVNPQVRSLNVQAEHWNGNDSVAAAAQQILADASSPDPAPLPSPRIGWRRDGRSGSMPPFVRRALDSSARRQPHRHHGTTRMCRKWSHRHQVPRRTLCMIL